MTYKLTTWSEISDQDKKVLLDRPFSKVNPNLSENVRVIVDKVKTSGDLCIAS